MEFDVGKGVAGDRVSGLWGERGGWEGRTEGGGRRSLRFISDMGLWIERLS